MRRSCENANPWRCREAPSQGRCEAHGPTRHCEAAGRGSPEPRSAATRPGLAATIALLVSCLLAGGTANAAAEPALAGQWVLDAERSDSVERASRSALRDVRRILQPRGNAPRPSSAVVTDRAELILAPLAPPSRRVSIELEDTEAVFYIDDQPARRHHTDGRAAVIDSNRPNQSIAAWEDGSLYVEQTFDNGTRIIEAWSLEGEQLRADYEARNSLFSEPIGFTLRFNRSDNQP